MQDGEVTITGKQIVLDCFVELVEAVLLSYAAVEALVNERIESLDGSGGVKRANARGIEAELGKAEMACRMSTGEKLDTAIPLVTGESPFKGTTFLERFVRGPGVPEADRDRMFVPFSGSAIPATAPASGPGSRCPSA